MLRTLAGTSKNHVALGCQGSRLSLYQSIKYRTACSSSDSATKQDSTKTGNVKVIPDHEKKCLTIDAPEFGIANVSFPYTWLRDTCQAPESVDPSTRQKLFQTSDIVTDLRPEFVDVYFSKTDRSNPISSSQEASSNSKEAQIAELSIAWEGHTLVDKDSPGSKVTTKIPLNVLAKYSSANNWRSWTRKNLMKPVTWHRNQLSQQPNLKVSYNEFCNNAEVRLAAFRQLITSGIIFFYDMPSKNKSDQDCELAKLGDMLGDIRRTWYGDKVWDVKSMPNSKNVAYTNLSLDLHMDLVHYENPPRYQLLHYLHSHPKLKGGQSYFVDSYRIAELIKRSDPQVFDTLANTPVGFEYRNGGHWRHFERPTFELNHNKKQSSSSSSSKIKSLLEPDDLQNEPDDDAYFLHAVNYSPPFQAPQLLPAVGREDGFQKLHHALSVFAKMAAEPELTYRIDLKPGECVAFDNRRVLHARTSFDVTEMEPTKEEQGNEPIRWLKGMYVEGDSLADRFRVLSEEVLVDQKE